MLKNKTYSLILFFLIALFTLINREHANAQSGLEFSQVLLVGNSVQSVPSGKVWKLESIWSASPGVMNSSCSSVSSAVDYARAIEINSVSLFPASATQTGSSGNIYSSGEIASFPYWLPAGTSVKAYCSGSQISVIEFTVIP